MAKKPINIVLIGPMGVGKTSVGTILARKISWDFYDSDRVIEEKAGADILWIYDLEGEEGFRKREEKVIAQLIQKPSIILATGGSTVVTLENREKIVANSFVIYLRTSLDDQLVRTGYSKKRPLSTETEERRSILCKLRQEHEPLYEGLADIVYDTDNKRSSTVVLDLLELIKNESCGLL